MDAALASYHARLATFEGAATTGKGRRTSSRSKKAGTKSKAAWPLHAPSAQDLAYAGFVWKPTSASPDNVQCFSCECQLDGWEEEDIPAFEHLTHSPSCGFAAIACIRLRAGDPGRTEDDPTSDSMVAARRSTFADMWPLDPSAGYPTVDQMVAAGWFYDPSTDTPDGVTCPYCALALDAWDIGDDPMQEHRRRSPECLFFTLSNIYNKPVPVPKKGKRASTKKRASARSSTASTASRKGTRGRKRTSDAMEETTMEYSSVTQSEMMQSEITQPETTQPPPKRLRSSSIESFPSDLPVGTPKKTPTGLRETRASSMDMSSLPADLPVGTPKRTPPMMSEADEPRETLAWKPADIDALFSSHEETHGFMNDILIDSGLDNIEVAGLTPERLYELVSAGLTDHEKGMTIEQWVLYNAKRGEEKLRMACEQQILAFEAEGRRAMAVLEGIPTL
ncbi:BIR domain containing protein [Pyrenophora tritici-repentis]|nr:BIR domain containing protein [Pyrenophora tritici-repentis]KAI2482503.1 BIR domain containing protein [Pyrenophora tritici-repentis]